MNKKVKKEVIISIIIAIALFSLIAININKQKILMKNLGL